MLGRAVQAWPPVTHVPWTAVVQTQSTEHLVSRLWAGI